MRDNHTIDNNTVASNPGNAQLNKWVWFCHNKMIAGSLILFLIGSVLATIAIDTIYLLLVGIAVIMNFYYWINKNEHFLSGHSNVGIVVGTHPTLIAVNSDLSKGYGYFPVIKIQRRESLKKVSLGDRVPTVALYRASSNDFLSHWIDFDPVPLSYATNDVEIINSAMRSYPSEQWQQLERYLLELDKPYKTGLYQVDKEQSGWNELSNDSLNVLYDLQERDANISLTKIVGAVIIFIAILKALEIFT